MCGCHESGYYLVSSLLKAGVKFDHFVTLDPEIAAKNHVSGFVDFAPLAKEYDIPVYFVKSYGMTHEDDVAFFQKNSFDLLIQGGWQRLFPDSVLKTLSIGAIGGHGSADFLPKGRGRSPLNWSIIEGKKRFIMQLFLIKEGVDDGPVFDSEMFDINEFDCIRTLYFKNSIVTKRMILRNLDNMLTGKMSFLPQVGEPSYYPKRTEDDSHIDWENMDVWKIHDFVRAQAKPYPGATAQIDGKTYKIYSAQVFDTRISYPESRYGEVVETFAEGFVVNCRGGLLLVKEHQVIAAQKAKG